MAAANPKSMLAMGSALLLCAAGPAFAGKLSGEKIKQDTVYKVTECKRPDSPKVKDETIEGYEEASIAYQAFAMAQQQFVDCVEREAGEDMRALQEIIFAGGQEAIARAQREIDALKTDLDALRVRLESEQ